MLPINEYNPVEGVTKASFVSLSVNKIFDLAKVPLRLFESHLYSTGVTAAQLQFAITSWEFECERLSKLQKRGIRIMTNDKYNAHTDPLFKNLKLLKNKDIFDVQCIKICYSFVNNNVLTYFTPVFRYNRELHDIQTRSHELLHLYPVRTSNSHNALRRRIPELCKYPAAVLKKARTHSIMSFTSHVKFRLLDSFCSDCLIPRCYICTRVP